MVKYHWVYRSMICFMIALLLSGCATLQTWWGSLFGHFHDPVYEQVTTVPVMQRRVRMIFPYEVKTIGEAVNYLLSPYRYRSLIIDPETQRFGYTPLLGSQDVNAIPLFLALKRILPDTHKIVLDENRLLYSFSARRSFENPIMFANLILEQGMFSYSITDAYPDWDQPEPGTIAGEGNVSVVAALGEDITPAEPMQSTRFVVQNGSLRANAIRLAKQLGWHASEKEWFLDYDYTIQTDYIIEFRNDDEAFEKLLQDYNVVAVFLDNSQKIVFEELR